jgi:hypothetical protein
MRSSIEVYSVENIKKSVSKNDDSRFGCILFFVCVVSLSLFCVFFFFSLFVVFAALVKTKVYLASAENEWIK